MKRPPLFLIPFIVGVVFSLPLASKATTLASQLNSSVGDTGATSVTGFMQQLGPGISGLFTGFTVKFSVNDTAIGTKYQAFLDRCTTGYYTGSCINIAHWATIADESAGNGLPLMPYTVSTTTPISLNPAYYYYFGVSNETSTNSFKLVPHGTPTNAYTSGRCQTNSAINLNTLNDCFFILSGQSITDASYVTNFQPRNGSTTSTTNVAVSFDYNALPENGIDEWVVGITDLGSTGLFPFASSTIYLSGSAYNGTNSVSTNVFLASGHQYRLRPYIRDNTLNKSWYGTVSTIWVGSNWSNTLNAIDQGYFSEATTTTFSVEHCTPPTNILDVGGGISYAICIMFMPSPQSLDQFRGLGWGNKFPTAYVYDFQQSFASLTSSTTDSFASTTLSLKTLNIGSSTPIGNILPNLNFGKSAVMTYMSDSVYQSLMLLQFISIWLSVGWYLYNRATRIMEV